MRGEGKKAPERTYEASEFYPSVENWTLRKPGEEKSLAGCVGLISST